jgi:hypothetical protein
MYIVTMERYHHYQLKNYNLTEINITSLDDC